MQVPFPILIGLRYTRAKRRNHFISFIAMVSMFGIALGVMALITVLSVMNGFEKELKERILGMVPRVEVMTTWGYMDAWPKVEALLVKEMKVKEAAPFIKGQGMLAHRGRVSGVVVQGVEPALEGRVSNITQKVVVGDWHSLKAGEFNIILGKQLADGMGLQVGDKVTLVIPEASVTPAGVTPRFKRFTVTGLFHVGYQFDSMMAFVHLDDAARVFRTGKGVSGLHLQTDTLYEAPGLARAINEVYGGFLSAVDWTQSQGNYFEAVKLEKTIMFFMLLLIVAVAAFNLVSSLVMVVTDKKSDIAILRTMGASPKSILAIFMTQGMLIGVAGTVLGVVSGVILALNVTEWVEALEQALKVKFLSSDVYYISFLPSDLHWSDVWKIIMVSLAMSLVSTVYPAWKAAKTEPAEALRYE